MMASALASGVESVVCTCARLVLDRERCSEHGRTKEYVDGSVCMCR